MSFSPSPPAESPPPRARPPPPSAPPGPMPLSTPLAPRADPWWSRWPRPGAPPAAPSARMSMPRSPRRTWRRRCCWRWISTARRMCCAGWTAYPIHPHRLQGHGGARARHGHHRSRADPGPAAPRAL